MNESYRAPAEPGQIRENDWQRWYVGIGGDHFVVRYEVIANPEIRDLLTLPAYLFTQGQVGRPVGRWTGSLLAPEVRDEHDA